MKKLISTLAIGLLTAACGGEETTSDARDYYDGAKSAALGASTNKATCATCHAADGAAGYPGNTFEDIAYRSSYKGGDADLLGGVNACVTGWMGGTALTATSESYLKIVEFMQSISDSAVTDPNALAPEVLADEAAYEAAYAGGDATRGQALYGTYCGRCHDAALVVGAVTSPPKAGLSSRTVGRIAQQVRTAGPPPSGMSDASDTTPGPMPFFEMKDLSAADLKDIIAHIKG
ncbi:MAG: c-type cytochrome [Deltaproteobacteria bacterium]|nr:c-type cytochrome [Deltaproteobacteria bacterium]